MSQRFANPSQACVLALLVGLTSLAACEKSARKSTSTNRAAAPPAMGSMTAMSSMTPAMASPKPKAVDERGKWDCVVDADCVNSCSQGAVNRNWYRVQQRRFSECMDGCNNQISGRPRCVKGQCVAFDSKGMRRDYCTRKRAR